MRTLIFLKKNQTRIIVFLLTRQFNEALIIKKVSGILCALYYSNDYHNVCSKNVFVMNYHIFMFSSLIVCCRIHTLDWTTVKIHRKINS